MIGKALLNLDQSTLHLDPDFDPAEAIRDNLSHLLTSGLKVSPAGIMAAAIEAKEFTSMLPKRGNRILDSLAEGEFSMRVKALDEERLHTVLQRVANRVTLGIIIAATILGAAMMMRVPSEPGVRLPRSPCSSSRSRSSPGRRWGSGSCSPTARSRRRPKKPPARPLSV